MYDPKFKDKLLQLKFIKSRGLVRENSFKGHSLATNDRKMDYKTSAPTKTRADAVLNY